MRDSLLGRVLVNPALVATVALLGLLITVRTVLAYAAHTSDLSQDWTASLAVWEGVSIYGDEARERYAQATGNASMPNHHPPFLAVFFLPLALLPYPVAFVVWDALAVVLLLGLLGAVMQALRFERPLMGLVLALSFWWYPAYANLALGQVSTVVAVLIVGGWLLARRDAPVARVAAGALLGLACLLKLYPGFVMLYYLVRRRWVVLASCVVTGIVGVGATLGLVGLPDALFYAREVTDVNMTVYQPSFHNQSVAGLAARLFGDHQRWVLAPFPSPLLRVLVHRVGALVVLVVSAWSAVRHVRAGRDVSAFGVVLAGMLLLSPVAWQHYFIVLAPVLLLGIRELWTTGRAVGVLVILALIQSPDADLVTWMGLGTDPTPFAPQHLLLFAHHVGLVLTFAWCAAGLPGDAVADPEVRVASSSGWRSHARRNGM